MLSNQTREIACGSINIYLKSGRWGRNDHQNHESTVQAGICCLLYLDVSMYYSRTNTDIGRTGLSGDRNYSNFLF